MQKCGGMKKKKEWFAEVVLDYETKDGSYPRVLVFDAPAEKLKGALRGEKLKLLVEKLTKITMR
jgi:hypothetical protein